jgi:hypothetical protein
MTVIAVDALEPEQFFRRHGSPRVWTVAARLGAYTIAASPSELVGLCDIVRLIGTEEVIRVGA